MRLSSVRAPAKRTLGCDADSSSAPTNEIFQRSLISTRPARKIICVWQDHVGLRPLVVRQVVFTFHGYPGLIHQLTYRRPSQHNIHVRGYKEHGNINTPLELAIRNETESQRRSFWSPKRSIRRAAFHFPSRSGFGSQPCEDDAVTRGRSE